MRRLLAVLALLALAAGPSIGSLTNAERGSPLTENACLSSIAQRWTEQMADSGTLSHNPNLAEAFGCGMSKVGENVGRGPSVTAIHSAFMASPGHKANIVNPEYTHMGHAVVNDGVRVWVTVVFGRADSKPAPKPPPAKVEEQAKPASPKVKKKREEPKPPPPPEPNCYDWSSIVENAMYGDREWLVDISVPVC